MKSALLNALNALLVLAIESLPCKGNDLMRGFLPVFTLLNLERLYECDSAE